MNGAIYKRQSKDSTGLKVSVQEQGTRMRRIAAERGIEVVAELGEADASAWAEGRKRPDYDRLVAMVQRGEVDVVLSYRPDRMFRDRIDEAEFMVIARAAGLAEVVYHTKSVRPGDVDDEFTSGLDALLAQRESALIGRRMRDKHVAKASRGEWPGGPAPYGYRLVSGAVTNELGVTLSTLAPEPAEEAVIIESVRRALAGEPIVTIARDLSARGVRSRSGTEVRSGALAKFIANPATAGRRVHRGTIVDEAWPAIVSIEDHERLTAMFDRRRRGPRKSAPRKHPLGAGLLRCGHCGAGMSVGMTRGVWRYACPPVGNGGCNRTSISKEAAERRAVELLAAEVDSPRFRKLLARAARATPDEGLDAIAAQIAADRTQLALLADMLADGDLGRDDYKRNKARLEARIADGEAALARADSAVGPALSLVGNGEAIRDAWERMNTAEQADALMAVAERFVVRPYTVGGPRWQPERVELVPRFPG